MTKLLYLSCHASLELDELTNFTDLGLDVFPVGFYTDPDPDNFGIKKTTFKPDPILKEEFLKLHPNFKPGHPIKLDKNFANKFDIIYNAHFLENFQLNWDNIKHKTVIRRTITQGNVGYEAGFNQYIGQGLKTVRWTDKEKSLSSYLGGDAFIRISVDDSLFCGWKGSSDTILTIQSVMAKHPNHTQFHVYDKITKTFNRKLIGFGNHDVPWALPNATIEQILDSLRSCGVYLSMCTRPGAYSYSFAEAMVTGCPIVTVGPKIGNFEDNSHGKNFEQHELIEHAVSGFWSDDPKAIKDYLTLLLTDKALAYKISQEGKKRGLEIFGRERIKKDWRAFFKSIGVSCNE